MFPSVLCNYLIILKKYRFSLKVIPCGQVKIANAAAEAYMKRMASTTSVVARRKTARMTLQESGPIVVIHAVHVMCRGRLFERARSQARQREIYDHSFGLSGYFTLEFSLNAASVFRP